MGQEDGGKTHTNGRCGDGTETCISAFAMVISVYSRMSAVCGCCVGEDAAD